MSRPDKLPSWVDDDSTSKAIEPSSVKKLQGWIYKERPAFQFWNWIFRNFVKWVLHFDVSVNQYDCYASEVPDEFLNITAGKISVGVLGVSNVLQQIDYTGIMPTSAGLVRLDLIVIDNLTGIASRIAGTPNPSPIIITPPVGKTVLCAVLVDETDIIIKSSMIGDLRTPFSNIQLIDEDDFASDSDKVAPTQQSAKAYVDGRTASMNTKVVEIGDWNMDSTTQVNPSHGLTLSKIRSISVVIRNDSGTLYPFPFTGGYASLNERWILSSSNIVLSRFVGGVFDDPSFSSTSYNRGWITIQYTD